MVERYDEGYDWRYVVRSAHGRNAGANLDRRGEVWRYRRTLPADLRGRAGQTEITRGLGHIPLADALAEVRHLNAQVDAISSVIRGSGSLRAGAMGGGAVEGREGRTCRHG